MRFLSTYAILATIACCVLIDVKMELWQHQDRVIEHDVHGYYGFLPAIFIYDDIRFEKSDYRPDQNVNYFYFWTQATADGARIIKYPVGLAILYSPFFFIAHAIAPLVGAEPTGFSVPYKILLIICAIFYLWMGLLATRAILRRLGFTDLPIAITLLAIGMGTNLLCYSSQSSTMPHVHGFFLFAVFILLTMRWYENRTWGDTVLLGLTVGLFALVRPTNALLALFFLLYGITCWADVKERSALLARNIPKLATIGVMAILTWIPQFVYWYTITGEFVYYSYQDEGFFFTHPHIREGLFSFRKGWLIYTPMMLFAIAGIFSLRQRSRDFKAAIFIVMILHIYVTFSWWCWWYGGSFGQRAMIETYAMMAVPLCAFIDRIWQRALVLRVCFMAVIGFFIWLNGFQTVQYERGSLHYDAMDVELYFKQFGKMKKIKGFDEMLDHPDPVKALQTGR